MLKNGPVNLMSHVHEIVRPFWGIPGFLCSRQLSVLKSAKNVDLGQKQVQKCNLGDPLRPDLHGDLHAWLAPG